MFISNQEGKLINLDYVKAMRILEPVSDDTPKWAITATVKGQTWDERIAAYDTEVQAHEAFAGLLSALKQNAGFYRFPYVKEGSYD